jgi:hypothetical protein
MGTIQQIGHLSKQGGKMIKGRSIFGLMLSLTIVWFGAFTKPQLAAMANQSLIDNIVTANSQVIGEPQNLAQHPKSRLITWREFVERGGRRFVNRDYDLPSEFRNGYTILGLLLTDHKPHLSQLLQIKDSRNVQGRFSKRSGPLASPLFSHQLTLMEKRAMTYTFPISVIILMRLGTLSFEIGSAFGFASAPAIEAVGSAKAENVGDGGDDDVDDRDDTVPTR